MLEIRVVGDGRCASGTAGRRLRGIIVPAPMGRQGLRRSPDFAQSRDTVRIEC